MTHPEPGFRLQPVTADAVVSISTVVTRTLREAILRGNMRPGERLIQDHLAVDLKVSRQPVRAALHQLANEGLIAQLARRSYVVREYTEEDIRENYHLRKLLESEAAALAAERIQSEELEELKALNRTMAEAASEGDASRVVELNAHWHRLIHESARTPSLARLIMQLWVGHTVFTPLFIPGRAKRSFQEHEAVIGAMADHSPRRAAVAMGEHIAHGSKEYFQAVATLAKLGAGDAARAEF